MVKVYVPKVKGKAKTSARGYWRNNKGKLYYDYIEVVNASIFNGDIVEDLKVKHKQEALFYIKDNQGHIYYSKDNIEVLPQKVASRLYKYHKSIKCIKDLINNYLKCYGGLTIFDKGDYYLFEGYYNPKGA